MFWAVDNSFPTFVLYVDDLSDGCFEEDEVETTPMKSDDMS